MLYLLAFEALLGTGLELRARLGQFLQPVLAPRQLFRDRHAIGIIGLIRRLRLGHEFGHFGLQLRLDLAGTLIGKRSEEHTSELQSLMRISYAVFCLKKKK